VILISAVAVAAALPLNYNRHPIVIWLQGRSASRNGGADDGLDRQKPRP
jgi:hypothetical protein